ncbi:GTP cyclohydrolase N terminal [Fragilaria crotonensis]|nr:GTP cyclohydrolase N terminal [Fragilaria crotonensis]
MVTRNLLAPSDTSHRPPKKPRKDEDGIPFPELSSLDYVNLTSHSDQFGVDPVPISWAHPDPAVRGPVICTVRHSAQRNAIGAHSGSYCIYTGLAVAAGTLDPDYIAAMDPFGHVTTSAFGDWLKKGWDIRPTIAVTKAHIDLPECREAITAGRLKPDGKVLMPSGQSIVAKAAIEPVWYLPEVARRFECTETNLRQSIFRMTNGMYPELITRPDIKIFLPPIGGLTIYIWGDPSTIPDEDIELTCRVHDECNGSDVFGSDICTCRPYLTHAIEECIKTAQRGGCGIVVYFRKEGRSLGEVTSIWYTIPVNAKRVGTRQSSIKIVNRIEIPKELVPDDAQVEITAKVFHGYNAGATYQGIDKEELKKTKGRDYHYDAAT